MEARKLAWWAASPSAYAGLQVARQSRCRVLTGPFVGMRYPLAFVPRLLFSGPYQVGSFEHELHGPIGEIADAGPATVVNVGSAEGYYSVGLARRLPETRVVAFELDPRLREAAGRLAELNGVADRIEARGLCTVDELAALEPHLGADEVAVIMDCEGAEAELADPERVGWLARARLLIELHPAAASGVLELLRDRLGESHELREIAFEPRRASLFDAVLGPLRGLRRIDRELLVAEYRDGSQDWLWATPRS
jgi:hypothetical protein